MYRPYVQIRAIRQQCERRRMEHMAAGASVPVASFLSPYCCCIISLLDCIRVTLRCTGMLLVFHGQVGAGHYRGYASIQISMVCVALAGLLPPGV